MKCPECNLDLRRVEVSAWGAKRKAISYQCPKCDYYEFEEGSYKKVIEELRKTPLRIRQRVIKLSHDRLGMYFNKDIIRSLGIQGGEEIDVCIPDNKHIVIVLENKNLKG